MSPDMEREAAREMNMAEEFAREVAGQDQQSAPIGEAPSPAYRDEENEAVDETWSIKDLPTADWALSRLGALEREMAENQAIATAAVERILLRTDKLNATARRGAEFFRRVLATYAEQHRPELLGSGKKKSRALLHGSLGWRSRAEKLEVVDGEVVLAWAQMQPVETGVLRIKEELDRKALAALFKKTGELPPGTELEPASEDFYIKTEVSHGS